MVSALILPVASANIRRYVLSGLGIDIPGKYPFLVTGRAIVPASRSLVFFELISVIHALKSLR